MKVLLWLSFIVWRKTKMESHWSLQSLFAYLRFFMVQRSMKNSIIKGYGVRSPYILKWVYYLSPEGNNYFTVLQLQSSVFNLLRLILNFTLLVWMETLKDEKKKYTSTNLREKKMQTPRCRLVWFALPFFQDTSYFGFAVDLAFLIGRSSLPSPCRCCRMIAIRSRNSFP